MTFDSVLLQSALYNFHCLKCGRLFALLTAKKRGVYIQTDVSAKGRCYRVGC